MSGKTIPFSVRLSQEDAEFIAKLEIQEATTPSDKIRTIISGARKKAKKAYSYREMLKEMQEMVMPMMGVLREQELANGKHSELLASFAEWLTEVNAFFMAAYSQELNQNTMDTFEEAIASRIFVLFERVMRMGVTNAAPCYNKEVLTEKLPSVLELAEIINKTKVKVEA